MQQLAEHQSRDAHHLLINDWLHGIEYMTFDKNHCIYWKGFLIDFIKEPEQAHFQGYITDLAVQCQHLESIDVPINIETVVHFKDWFSTMKSDYKYKPLLMNCPDIRVSANLKIMVIQGDHVAEFSGNRWYYYSKGKDETQEEWSYRWNQQLLINRGYNGLPLSYSDLDGLNRFLEHFNVPVNLFDRCHFDFKKGEL